MREFMKNRPSIVELLGLLPEIKSTSGTQDFLACEEQGLSFISRVGSVFNMYYGM